MGRSLFGYSIFALYFAAVFAVTPSFACLPRLVVDSVCDDNKDKENVSSTRRVKPEFDVGPEGRVVGSIVGLLLLRGRERGEGLRIL